MKLVVKTVNGRAFNVDVEGNEKISVVKEKVDAVAENMPASNLVLIHSGQVLTDEMALDTIGLKEGGFLVAMVSAKKATTASKPKEEKKAETPAPAAAAVPTSSSSEQPTAAAAAVATPAGASVDPAATPSAPAKPEGGAEEGAITGTGDETATPSAAEAASNLVSGSKAEETIKGMMEMGFGREECQRALRAAYMNPERAVEYLMTGIPDGLEEQQPAPAPPPTAAAVATAAAPSPTTAPTAGGGPNARPLDMFNPAANLPATAGGEGAPGGGGRLQFLRDHPQFQTLRAMMASNPALLQPMLQELGKQNQALMQLINENQQEFYSLLNEPTEGMDLDDDPMMGGGGGMPPPGTVQIELTPEDNEAIDRLTSLGFDRTVAAQAFFACEKNEQLAANYLFDHGHELTEQ